MKNILAWLVDNDHSFKLWRNFYISRFKNTQFQKELKRQAQRVNEILIYFLKNLHITLGYKGGLNQFYTM